MHYCGVAVAGPYLQLCALQEFRADEPPIRLRAIFYEPGGADQLAAQLRLLEEVVVGVAAPASRPLEGRPARVCDSELARRGVPAAAFSEPAARLFEALSDLGVFRPGGGDPGATTGAVPEGAFRAAALFETNADCVFSALQGRRMPARRHPLGVLLRIEELTDDRGIDEGGDLWHRRIEEIEAAAAALAAHRYAVGHACWVGDPSEGVVVLPGSRIPDRFPAQGVLPPVTRARLPGTDGQP